MVLFGECVGDVETVCLECNLKLRIKVLRSAAGYYIGFFCSNCGPYSRESGYYGTEREAQKALENGSYSRITWEDIL